MRNILLVAGVVACSSLYAEEALVPLDGQNLDHTLMAIAHTHKQRLHPSKHFESFGDINFEEELGRHAHHVAHGRHRTPAAVGRHRAGSAIADAYNDVKQHVEVGDAKVHTKPVTNKEYYNFIRATGHDAPQHWKNGSFPTGTDKHPVVNVSFHDAQSYAKWANKRLPTQNEWMSAADQLSWDLEMPQSEWTSTISDRNFGGAKQVILDRNGSLSTMSPFSSDLNTGFRVVTPSSWNLPQPRGDAFMTPEGDIIRPDQSLETPGGDIITPSDTPYDYGQ